MNLLNQGIKTEFYYKREGGNRVTIYPCPLQAFKPMNRLSNFLLLRFDPFSQPVLVWPSMVERELEVLDISCDYVITSLLGKEMRKLRRFNAPRTLLSNE